MGTGRQGWCGRRLLAAGLVLCATLLAPAAAASGATLTKLNAFNVGGINYDVEATALSPAGDRLAVATVTLTNSGGTLVPTPWIRMYAVAADGSATQVPGSPFNVADEGIAKVLRFSPDGKLLAAVYTGSNRFGLHAVSPSGALTDVPPGNPLDGGLHPMSASF